MFLRCQLGETETEAKPGKRGRKARKAARGKPLKTEGFQKRTDRQWEKEKGQQPDGSFRPISHEVVSRQAC